MGEKRNEMTKPDAEVSRQMRDRRRWANLGMCVQQCGREAARGQKCEECAAKGNEAGKSYSRRTRVYARGPQPDRGPYTCGNCGELGHNRRTCTKAAT